MTLSEEIEGLGVRRQRDSGMTRSEEIEGLGVRTPAVTQSEDPFLQDYQSVRRGKLRGNPA